MSYCAKIVAEVTFCGLCLVLLAVAGLAAAPDSTLRDQVRRTEIAFARTMADRDAAGFRSF